jgi:hypothetical protein
MATKINPPTSSISDVIVPFGYGAFGYGYGTYGGESGVVNPQWNTNSGLFGLDNILKIPFVQATDNPSFVGASQYSIEFSSFFAKIVPAPLGNGTLQTSLIVQADKYNFVEMFIAPDGTFSAYVANNATPTLLSSPFPTYDPVAHAFWRIRNDDLILFHFDVSPDGNTWTELGNIPYQWNASAVTVLFLAGYTGITEQQGLRAYISSVNRTALTTVLSATTRSHASSHGIITATGPNALSGKSSGFSGHKSHFIVTAGIPEGGMTDFAMSSTFQPDAARTRQINASTFTLAGGASVNWSRGHATRTAPTTYRDGSYWPPAAAVHLINGLLAPVSDTAPTVITNAQLEQGIGAFNRLSVNASFYTDSCCYSATHSDTSSGNGGTTRVERSSAASFAGGFSGKMTYSGTPIVDASGHNVYFAYPARSALVPVNSVTAPAQLDQLRGSVRLSTQRAGTQWYAAMFIYDVNFNILSVSTINQATVTNMNTHPGSGVFQIGTIVMPATTPSTAVWAAVVPVVVAPVGSEVTYMSDHRLVGINPQQFDTPSAYRDPQQITIDLKANRVNYAMNAGFNVDITGWATAASGIPSNLCTISWDGTVGMNSLGSLKASYSGGSLSSGGNIPGVGPAGYLVDASSTVYPVIQDLKQGVTYNFSAWVLQGTGCPDVTMSIQDPNYDGLYSISVNQVKNTLPSETVEGWTRVQANFTVPPNGLQDYRLWFAVAYSDITALSPFSFWIDNILVEQANTAGSFFDGNYASADYQYELGGNQNSRTHYYQDFANKLNRINIALPQYAPLGSTFNILSAQPPS